MALRTHGDLLRVAPYACSTPVRSGAIVSLNSAGAVVEQTNASTAILGVAIGYADGINETSVTIADHPDQEYVVEADDGSAFTQTDIGNNCACVAGTAYMTTESGNAIDHTSKATTSTLPFRIVGIQDSKDSGSNGAAVIRPNNHQEKAGVTGV